MTWGKMARKALQACAQKCGLILHFFTLWPPSLLSASPLFSLRRSDVFVAPTVLVTEHFEKTSVCLLNEESPATSSPVHQFWIKPWGNVKELQRAEGPHSSGPLCSRGPGRGLVSEVAVRQFTHHSMQGLNTSESLSFSHKHTQSCPVSTFLLSKTLRCLVTSKCGKGTFLQGLSFFFLLFHHPFTTQPYAR